MNWAREQRGLSSNEMHVLKELANYAWDDGSNAFPTMQSLARYCCMSRPTVARVLDRLEHFHKLIVKERSGKQSGTANKYRLQIDRVARPPAEIAPNSPLDPAVEAIEDPQGCLILIDPTSESSPQGRAPDARPGVYHSDTPGVSCRARGRAPDARPGASELDVPHPSLPVKNPQRACAGEHLHDDGTERSCGAGVPGCTAFMLDDATAALGVQAIAELRAHLLSKADS